MTSEQLSNLRTIASAAVATERATNVPAALITAQCCLESSWLMRAPGMNPFGIKKAKRHAMSQMLTTHEVCKREQMEPGDVIVEELPDGRVRVRGKRAFAAYQSLEAAFSDHALLIATGLPYAKAWQAFRSNGDVHALFQGVAQSYASDPAYCAKLRQIADRPEVKAAIEEARGVAPLPPAA